MKEISIMPIGIIKTTRSEIKDDDWGENISTIELDGGQFNEDVLYGLEEFSHLEVIFHFHKVDPSKIETGARHPRNNYLLFALVHMVHHRGQLASYLRPMGGKVPSIYGGSYDEPWQGAQ